jgi:hypothetical protein
MICGKENGRRGAWISYPFSRAGPIKFLRQIRISFLGACGCDLRAFWSLAIKLALCECAALTWAKPDKVWQPSQRSAVFLAKRHSPLLRSSSFSTSAALNWTVAPVSKALGSVVEIAQITEPITVPSSLTRAAETIVRS